MQVDSGLGARPAREDEFEFFFEVRREALGPYAAELWGWRDEEERQKAAAEFGRLPIQVIELDGARAGYFCVLHEEDCDDLDEIALASTFRRKGVGTRLIEYLLRRARERGVLVRLSVLRNNPAVRLYERLGFLLVRRDGERLTMERG